jgi:HEAT repeat protein
VRHPALKEIESLMGSPDPQVRIYSLVRLENHLDELEYVDIERVLDMALRETDRSLNEQARRIQALLKNLGITRYGEESTWPIFRHTEPTTLDRFPRLKTADIDKMRVAAYDLITPSVIKLHTEVLKGEGLPRDKVIETLARLRLPQSTRVLHHVGQDPFLAERVVDALAQYRTVEADELLLSMAENPAIPVNLKATELLGRSESNAIPPFLEKSLRDPDARRRRAAANALGHRREPKTTEWLLVTLADTAEEVVIAGIQALGRQRAVRAAENLIKVGREQSTRVRATVAAALARIQTPSTFDFLQLLLEDPDARVKANALESLAFHQLGSDQATRIFIPSLRSEVPRIRGNAVLGLFRYRTAQAIESLSQMFKSPDRMMRRAAAYCAGQIQNPETAHWVTTMILTEQTPEVLKAGMTALQRFQRRESVETYMRMTTHPRIEVRILAMQILGSIGGTAQIGALNGLYKKEQVPKVRSAIVSALAQLAGQNALGIIPPFLSDGDDRVVANAIQGLHDMNNIEAVSHLKPLLFHRSRRVRANSMVALFSLGDVKIIAEIQKLVESKDPKDQASGLWALGAIGEDLRLGSLEERYMLCAALKDHHRKAINEEVSGARLAESMASIKRPPPPSAIQSAMADPHPAGVGSVAGMPRPAHPNYMDPLSVVGMQRPDLGQGQPAGEPDDNLADQFERALVWEKLLDLCERDQTLALEALSHHTREFPGDEIGLLLYFRLSRELESDDYWEMVTKIARQPHNYLALLYELARALKEGGDIELSMHVYLQIFRAQYQALDRLASLAQEGASTHPQLPTSTLKLLSQFSGLVPGFDQELGDFYLGELMFDQAFHHLYRARMIDPSDSQISLKLAYICRKRAAFQLGKSLAKSVANFLPEDHIDHQRAVRMLKDIRAKEQRMMEGEVTEDHPIIDPGEPEEPQDG